MQAGREPALCQGKESGKMEMRGALRRRGFFLSFFFDAKNNLCVFDPREVKPHNHLKTVMDP